MEIDGLSWHRPVISAAALARPRLRERGRHRDAIELPQRLWLRISLCSVADR
jgi:hypothetical protein